MGDSVISGCQFGRCYDVFQHASGLYFGNTDYNRIILIDGCNIKKYPLCVVELFVIFGCIPFLGAIRSELVIQNFGIIDCIKEVLEIIENHLIRLLCETE